jgi:hypothetical protein
MALVISILTPNFLERGCLWFRIGNGEKQEMPFGRYQKLKREAPKEESNEYR